MKKYVVIAVNDNPIYSYYLPLVVWAWRSLGWDVFIFYCGGPTKINDLIMGTFDLLHQGMTAEMKAYYRLFIIGVDPIDGFKTSTIAQVSRLYACCAISGDRYLMTSDADLLPLSDYWKVSVARPLYTDRNGSGHLLVGPKPTTYGRDLTDYHYPMAYIGALSSDWVKIMQIDKLNHDLMIKRDLETIKPRIDEWQSDQDIVTQRINEYGVHRFTHIPRGVDKRTGYPLGRIDRSNWHLNHAEFIDAHLFHDTLTNDDSFKKILELLHHVWPTRDFKWFIEYTKEFKKLI